MPAAAPVVQSGAAEPKSWPGPFATARQLLNNREAVKAAREAEGDTPGGKRKAPRGASPGPIKRSRSAEEGPDDTAAGLEQGEEEEPLEGGVLVSAYRPSWEPSRALPMSLDADCAHRGLDAADEAAGKGKGKSGDAGERSRRAVAVAGPSGVRLSVPPLSVLVMDALIPHLAHAEELGQIEPLARRRFAEAVCRSRAMDAHAFGLFASPDADEVLVPDCAGVDEPAMTSALSACDQLSHLDLRHCGRGMTDRCIRSVAPSCFRGLHTLRLDGAHVLTDAGLCDALRHAPQLRHLRIGYSPIMTGAFVGSLPALTPHLQSLEIEACARVNDAQLLGGGGSSADKAAASSRSSSSSVEWRGGLFGLPSLNRLVLAQLPLVTDDTIARLVKARGPALTSIRIDRCPQLGDATVLSLAEHCPNLTSIELQSVPGASPEALRKVSSPTCCARQNLRRAMSTGIPM